ncbi:unnamed protein product [Alopecurus aequalis]
MAHKRPLGAAAPEEQEAARSPRKRLRRTVLVMMWLERTRRARAVTVEQMAQTVRQVQLDMARLLMLLMVLVARNGSMERLLLDLPNIVQRLLAEQLGAFQRSFVGSIEEKIRSVVQTEMHERQEALLPNGVYEPPRLIKEGLPKTGGISGVVKLRFIDAERPKDTLYTGFPVQWQNGGNAKVAIFRNEKQIMDGDLSKLQIEILPVHADFFTERGQDDFTEEELNKQIHMYKGKESVLKTVNLRNGEAYLGSIFFTECSYRKKLRLTARVKRQDLVVRVQEAISDPFIVKVGRSKVNEKSYLPSKGDAVHQLKGVCLKGKRCTALTDEKITTVKHLMRQYHKDKSGLQKLTGMKKEEWSTMIEHATTCDPGDEIYSYRVAEENGELLFNDFYDLVGMMMVNGFYIHVRDLKFHQLIVNNWKMSAYKEFEVRENSGGLVPDYLMKNGYPVRVVPLNNEADPSEQAKTTWQYPTDMAAQHGASLTGQQNGYLSSLTTDALSTSGPVTAVEFGQHHPPMPQNGTPCYLIQGNILNGQGPLSGQPTIPPHILLPIPEDNLLTDASLTGHQNGYLSSLVTDAPDGVNQGSSSLNHFRADIWSGLPPNEELLELQAHLTDQHFTEDNNEELPNFNYQFDDYEQDGGNL